MNMMKIFLHENAKPLFSWGKKKPYEPDKTHGLFLSSEILLFLSVLEISILQKQDVKRLARS